MNYDQTSHHPIRILIGLAILLSAMIAGATPYVPIDVIRAQERGELLATLPDRPLPPPNEINPYNYRTQYLRTAQWLRALQVRVAGIEFGGQREGETGSLYTIIQTDNTQESILVWSNTRRIYQIDTLFTEELRSAWIYCRNWPAWSEEGGNGGYYRNHNAGWGLSATMAYVTATRDSSVLGYGDSCANYIRQYPAISSSNTERNAEGIATGALARYARWRVGHANSQVWLDTALARGQRLRTWIESNPTSVLRSAESWALCGGCTFWGVLNSICRQNPAWGVGWVNQYGPFMDGLPGAGSWSNAWATWYGHAHSDAYEFTQNHRFLDSALTITDYLLNQDTDLDGGIVATPGDPQNQDQSWVSCYMDWMLLDPLMRYTGFRYDIGVVDFSEPNSFVVQGDSLRFRFNVQNYGTQTVAPRYSFYYGADSSQSTVFQWNDASLESGMRRTITGVIPGYRVTGNQLYTRVVAVADSDTNLVNNAMSRLLNVRDSVRVSVHINANGVIDSNAISTRVTLLESPNRFYTMSGGNYSVPLFAGVWRFEITPPHPFRKLDTTVSISASRSIEFQLQRAFVLLTGADSINTVDQYYRAVLDSLHVAYRYESNYDTAGNASLLSRYRTVIWYTGIRTTPFSAQQLVAIRIALATGTNFLITGQNAGEQIARSDTLLLARLGVSIRSNDVNGWRIMGTSSAPWNAVNTLIAGSLGANNQTHQDGFSVRTGASIWSVYSHDLMMNAAVSTSYTDSAKTLICGFGMEAISGTGRNSMLQMMDDALVWLGERVGVDEEFSAPLPLQISFSAYPNPFNPTIRFTSNHAVSGPIEWRIFNVQGETVRTHTLQNSQSSWEWNASRFAPGVYFVQMKIENSTYSRKIVLLK